MSVEVAHPVPWKARKGLWLALIPVAAGCLLWLASFRATPIRALHAITFSNTLLNVIALTAVALRARHWPAERKGWLLLGVSGILGVSANLLLGWTRPDSLIQPNVSGWYFHLNLVTNLLQAWAILSWPWRPAVSHHRTLDVLGSLLFASSLFLLFWVIGVWHPAAQRDATVPMLVYSRAARVALVGGVAMYILVQDPRRMMGPLGWILGGILLGHGGTLVTILKLQAGTLHQAMPWLAFPLMYPMALAVAALRPGPLEATESRQDAHPLAGLLVFMYIPFALVSALLAALILRSPSNLTWPLLIFLGITGVLVIRQYLFMQEVQKTSLMLAEREAALRAQAEDLRRSNEALQMANEEKDCLFGIVSHDLRNPINGVILAAQLIQEEEDLDACRDLARKVQVESVAMAGLVSRFLDLASMEAGRLKPSPEEAPLKPMFLQLLERHRAQAKKKGITLDASFEDLPESGWIDIKFLQGVLDNLVSNAVKFSPLGSQVSLTARFRTAQLWIEVQDQGPGFTAEDRAHLFGRFARLSAKPTGGEKSSGLGLSIVKHMVEAMGGDIDVESTPGHGATFRLRLPLDPKGTCPP